MPDEPGYDELVRSFSVEELQDVEANIDRITYPDRYEMVVAALERRRSGGVDESLPPTKEQAKTAPEASRRPKAVTLISVLSLLSAVWVFGSLAYVKLRFEPGPGPGPVAEGVEVFRTTMSAEAVARVSVYGLLLLVASIQFLRLRRSALWFFGALLVFSVAQSVHWYASDPGPFTPDASMFIMEAPKVVLAAVCIYAFRLRKRGVLT